MLWSLQAHADMVRVARYGLHVLASVCVERAVREDLAADRATVSITMELMGKHTADAHLQEYACVVLRGIASVSDASKKSVTQEGAVGAIVTSLLAHLAEAGAAREALRALSTLAEEQPATQRCVAEEGGLGAVVSAMQSHIEVPLITHVCYWHLL